MHRKTRRTAQCGNAYCALQAPCHYLPFNHGNRSRRRVQQRSALHRKTRRTALYGKACCALRMLCVYSSSFMSAASSSISMSCERALSYFEP
ncbi:MAG: hypothetical protein PVF08_03770, partial [Gammaproteobacteria bacterium]